MTKPKTEEELQDRVLEVLRRAFPDAHHHTEYGGGYWLCSLHNNAELGSAGHLRKALYQASSTELEVLAEASRLLREGIEPPGRLDRALGVLRAEFQGVAVEIAIPTNGQTTQPAKLVLAQGLTLRHTTAGYESHAWHGVNMTASQHRAIARALDILNNSDAG